MNLSLTNKMTPTKFLLEKKIVYLVIIGMFLLVYMTTAALTDFDAMSAISSFPRVVKWILENTIPDIKAISRLPNMMEKLLDTVLMSIMSTVTAGFISFFFAIMASLSTRPNRFISFIVKIIASVNRNIPVVAWAMIFLLTFGQSSFTGFLALFFASFGFLTKAFMESIDDTSSRSVEALTATGASYYIRISQGVLPSVLPQVISWVLYMIEVNIRSATLVGLLTGSGVGFIFSLYYKSLQYKSASLLVLLIMAVILLLELVTNNIRRKIL